MSGSFFAIGWISIAKTDEIVIATGKLVPENGVIDVQMPIEGIASKIHIKEGDKVFAKEYGNEEGAQGLAVVPKGQEEAVIESAEECPGECIMIEPNQYILKLWIKN